MKIGGDGRGGNYYIGAIADTTNVIADSNEDNNAAAGNTIKIR